MSFLNRIPNHVYIFASISVLFGTHFYKMNQIKKENELLYGSLHAVIDNYKNINNDLIKIYESEIKNKN